LGAAMIGPGVSGSALAVAFGIYDNLISIIADPFKKFWDNVRYLIPLGLGWVLGIGLLAVLLNYLFTSETSEVMVTYLFIGLMLGSLPSLFREANKEGFNKSYLGWMAVAFLVFLTLGFWLTQSADGSFSLQMNLATALLGGAVMGFVAVAPGISNSFVLMFLGLYAPLMAAVSSLDIPILAMVIVGALTAVVLFAKFVKFLLTEFYGKTYYFFIGLAISAMILVWPSLPSGWLSLGAIGLLAVGVVGGHFLSKLGDNKK